jgi:hypothetical protein
MTTVPPPSTPPPQLPAGPAPATAVLILQPPPAVVALPAGTVLEAVVIPAAPAKDVAADGGKPTVTLRTPQGDVQIRLPVQLPDNARVALEVLRSAAQSTPQVTVRVVSIDSQPAAQVLAQLARQTAANPAPLPVQQPLQVQSPLLQTAVLTPGAAWTPAGPLQMTALGNISAFVTLGAGAPPPASLPDAALPAPATVQTPSAPPPALALTTGGELTVRVTTLQLPQTAAPSAPGVAQIIPPGQAAAPQATAAPVAAPVLNQPVAAPAAPAAPNIAQAPPPVAATTSAAPGSPQPGLVLTGTAGLGAPPPQPPQGVQPPPVLATLTGTVTSLAPGGAPIVTTDAGQIQINVRANLPVGTRVTLEVTAQVEPRSGAPNTPPTPASALPLTGPAGAAVGWPTLSESLGILRRSDAQAAAQLAQAIPDGGARTVAALISFAQAMRGGDARQWPGDMTLRALERTGPRGAHLASQLSQEVAALSSRARETGTEWRALPLPWHADGHIERITLITRREGESDEGDKTKRGGGTRFLIDLDLSRLGAIQLDGMFRKETRGFDLMIRTKAALPEDIRLDLTGIFAASNAAMGLKGGLTFQVVRKFADPLASGGTGGWDKSGLWA